MTTEYNELAKYQVNAPVTREMLDLVDDARWPLRISRAEFARRALAAYVEQMTTQRSA
ncbi:hypothetical protein GA0061099_1004461 [Bradyrhizobium yuanmingense]|uniref:Ribbon-helix-helix protein CopG domain-containing protein n=1 Tax=Bradyrhizobium yuanmingense TaxID=108015 RepID=A0A1C3VRK5_9BRAD|nr:hypothetical protein [Bradyrhizobium yuanmingense]TWI28873.1 hypothetical protein IQ15_02220 [Bradyrhizobium yuanmingense]SCB30421.1 hypothetical protein GA0061099_1004461 [Bradyrhizobium yuanmingense]